MEAATGCRAAGDEPVYASIDAVPVPADVLPGQAFTALVWGKRAGQRVPVKKQLWRATGQAPIIVRASAHQGEGARFDHRPAAVARSAEGSWRASPIDHISLEECGVEQWVSNLEMPPEVHSDDVGWLPGPVGGSAGRDMPEFTGPPMGSRDSKLSLNSTARAIMRAVQFTRKFKEKVVACTKAHAQSWQAARERLDSTERSFNAANFKAEHVELFFAIAVRLAKLNPAIPARRLWDHTHHCYDSEVNAVCGFTHWQWLNRHISFGQTAQGVASDEEGGSGSGSDEEADPPSATDRYRTCRVVSDIARVQAARAFNPGQHIGFDDCVREDKHRGCRRIRHKASVHSGRAVDALNCARSKYFMAWEEQGWLRDEDGGEGGGGSEGGSGGAGGGGSGADGSGGGGRGGATTHGRGSSPGRAGGAGRGRGGRSSQGRGRGGHGGQHSGRGRGNASSNEPATAETGAGDDADDEDAMSDGDAGDSPAAGVNSVHARLQRACSVLRPNVGHCLWLDRGMSSVRALQGAKDAGFHITGLVQANRCGLPRRYLAQLKKKLACQRGCKHAHGSAGCNRWSWTVLHKGEWELEVWSDGAVLVLSMSSCTSATQCVRLGRTVDSTVWLARCPMGIGYYNLFGRSPTDSGDQQRQKLSLSSRRRTRQGPKHALFDAEIGFVNGNIMAENLGSGGESSSIWDFADRFCTDVLASVTMRKRAVEAAAAGRTRADEAEHTPIDFLVDRAKGKRAGSSVPVTGKRGRACCCTDCDPGEPKRPRLFCPGCAREREGCSGWYHMACYWRRHRACLK